MIELYANEIYIINDDLTWKNDGERRNIGEEIEGNVFSDGKWRFIIIDLDYSMNYSSVKTDKFNFTHSRIGRAKLQHYFFIY